MVNRPRADGLALIPLTYLRPIRVAFCRRIPPRQELCRRSPVRQGTAGGLRRTIGRWYRDSRLNRTWRVDYRSLGAKFGRVVELLPDANQTFPTPELRRWHRSRHNVRNCGNHPDLAVVQPASIIDCRKACLSVGLLSVKASHSRGGMSARLSKILISYSRMFGELCLEPYNWQSMLPFAHAFPSPWPSASLQAFPCPQGEGTKREWRK